MPRQVRPKKKTSPQGQENQASNVVMDEEDREYSARAYDHRELAEISKNAQKALKKAQEAYEIAKKKAEPMSYEEYKRMVAHREHKKMLSNMPSLPKLRKKTKSLSKTKTKTRRTRKYKTL